MKSAFAALLASALLCTAAACTASPDATADLEREIRRLELAHADAILHGDEAALTDLMAPDLTVNHPTNRIVEETRGILELIRAGVIRYAAFERIPERIIRVDGTVVVMGHEFVTPAAGAPNAGQRLQRRYTNLWTRRDGRWQLTIRHANNVCPEVAP